MHDFDETDLSGDGYVDRSEFLIIIEKAASFPSNGHAIVSDELWNSFDSDHDGKLNGVEFTTVAHRMALRSLYVEPVLVFPARKVEYDYDFKTVQSVVEPVADDSHQDVRHQVFSKACENFILPRVASVAVPYSSMGWNELYRNFTTVMGLDPLSKVAKCRSLEEAEFDAVVFGQQSDLYVLPMLATAPGSNAIFIDLDSKKIHDNVRDDPKQLFDRVSRLGLEVSLWSRRNLPDVIHVFDTGDVDKGYGAEILEEDSQDYTFSQHARIDVSTLALAHKANAEKKFADDTTVIILGAVMFPREWTQLSDCGLFEAIIRVKDESASSDAVEYKTDESGWFEFAVTNGKTYTITASYPTHDICYSGGTLDDATRIWSCDGKPAGITLSAVSEMKYVFFTDATTANIDLGLYQGECNNLYDGATFKVTPINGCHPPAYFTSLEINAWLAPDREKAHADIIPSREANTNGRRWPLAAMDYSITIEEGPSTADIIEKKNEEYPNADCESGAGGIIEYFRQRPEGVERLAPMRTEHTWISIRYKYHGYLCSEFVDIPAIGDESDTCWDKDNEKNGAGIAYAHFLGRSAFFDQYGGAGLYTLSEKHVRAKVYELHLAKGTLQTCTKFPGTESGGRSWVEFRQGITNIEANPCHTNRNGGPFCDFEIEIDENGYLLFPSDDGAPMTNSRIIPPGLPRFSGNFRRPLELHVHRFDGATLMIVDNVRELIPLGSRPRGESTFGEYSDDVYWATVPLEGLVYTTVHDPPGGNSYAELMLGTEVSMSIALSNEQAASVSRSFAAGGGVAAEVKNSVGFAIGYMGLATFDFEFPLFSINFDGFHSETGPEFSVSESSSSGWDLTATLSRVIRTSTDVAIPGRSGDVVLGGGVEVVYKMSDTLDISVDDYCLHVSDAVTWLPRKPTSYVFIVHTVEAMVIPNLQYLLSVVQAGRIDGDDSGMTHTDWVTYLTDKVDAWRRTLLWASPTVYKTRQGSGESVQYVRNSSAVERIMVPFMNAQSLFGEEAEKKLNEYHDELRRPLGEWDGGDQDDLLPALRSSWENLNGVDVNIDGVPGGFEYAGGAESAVDRMEDEITSNEDISANKAAKRPDQGQLWWGRMSYAMDADFLARFTEGDNSFTTMGMNAAAQDDLSSTVSWCRHEKCDGASLDRSSRLVSSASGNLGEDGSITRGDTLRVDASFTGSEALTGFDVPGAARGGAESEIFLTFSGGGAATEFIFSSNENIDGQEVAWTLGLDASASNGYSLEMTVVFVHGHYSHEASMSKSATRSRAFAWSKYERMSTVYALGDPEFGDKFVIQVSSDSRFGTPVFLTQGGRSKCPGEKLTVFREAGFAIDKASTYNERLNPGENAVIQLKIVNESPYKEVTSMGLRLVDGVADCVQRIIAAALRAAEEDECNATHVQIAVNSTADGHECLASESTDVQKLKSDVAALIPQYEALGASAKAGWALARTVASLTQTSAAAGAALQGLKFSVNGIHMWSFGEVLPLQRLAGERTDSQSVVRESHVALIVEPVDGMYESRYLGVSLVSLCESMIESYMDRPIVSSTVSLGPMSWSKKCPKVAFHTTTLMKEESYFIKSASSASTLDLLVINPDRYSLWPGGADSKELVVNNNLQFVYLQYRPVSGGEWITAKDEFKGEGVNKNFNILCSDSRGDGCRFEWNLNDNYNKLLSGYKDGTYEIRLKSMCTGGNVFADSSVHEYVSDQKLVLKIDTKDPLIGALSYVSSQSTLRVDFMEPIDCTMQVVSVARGDAATGPFVDVSEEDIKSSAYPYIFQCVNAAGSNEGRWLLKFPSNARGYYRVSVSAVTDVAGNRGADFDYVAPVRVSEGSEARLGTASLSRSSQNDTGDRRGQPGRDDAFKFALPASLALASLSALLALVLRSRRASADGEASRARAAREKTPLITRDAADAYGAAASII